MGGRLAGPQQYLVTRMGNFVIQVIITITVSTNDETHEKKVPPFFFLILPIGDVRQDDLAS